MIYTYQDLLKVANDDKSRAEFVLKVINNHKSSDDYKTAAIAEEYNKHKNVTITEYQKILYTVTGKAIPDNFSANFKMAFSPSLKSIKLRISSPSRNLGFSSM